MKIKEIIRKGWKRLPVRLLTVVLSTVLPILIISIVVSGMIFANSIRQIQDSFQRELDGGLTYFWGLLEDMDNYYESSVAQHLTELSSSSTDTDPAVYASVLDRLRAAYDYAKCDGVFYIYDRRSKNVYFQYKSDRYSEDEVNAMKRKLEKLGEMQDSKMNWRIEHLGHYYFMSRANKYTDYQIGIYIDLERSLSSMFGKLATNEVKLYLKYKKYLLQFSNAKLTFVENRTWEGVFEGKWREKNVFSSSADGTNKLGVLIPLNKYFARTQILYILLILLAAGGVPLTYGLWHLLHAQVILPLTRLDLAMQEVEQDNLDFRIGITDENETTEFTYLYESFNRMVGEIKEAREKEKKMYQTELDNLKLQVNPHMLLNSFNMVYSLAQTKNYECIQRYSMLTVEYFRYVLRENSSFVILKKEMDFVVDYVEIQKIRFPNTFSFAYKVEEEVLTAYVPPLLLQNFVENSMKYGLIPGKCIEILINIRKEMDRLKISVTDTGRGMTGEVLNQINRGEVYLDRRGKKHIGIWNCRRRLEVFYGKDTELHVSSKPGEGTQVWMEVPLIYEADGSAVPEKERGGAK